MPVNRSTRIAIVLTPILALAMPAMANVAPSPSHFEPKISCSPPPETWEEAEKCPYFPTCTLTDALGGTRATFRATVWWWEAVDMERVVLAISTCRSPTEGRTSEAFGPGDAPMELVEVSLTPDGLPRWRLLARENRGEWGCGVSLDGLQAVCAAVHVTRSPVTAWQLDLAATPVTATRLRPDTDAWVLSIHEVPRVRHREGRFQVWLDEPQGWFDLVPPSVTANPPTGPGALP